MARRTGRSVTESIVKQSGSPRFLGTITGSVSTTNETTAAPFNITGLKLLGKILLLQPDTACYILPVQTATGATTTAVTAANGILIQGQERVEICMDDQDQDITQLESFCDLAMLPVTGTTVLKVWELI